MAKRTKDRRRYGDRINIPVDPSLKQRVIESAAKYPGQPDPTKYARLVLEEFVGKLPMNTGAK